MKECTNFFFFFSSSNCQSKQWILNWISRSYVNWIRERKKQNTLTYHILYELLHKITFFPRFSNIVFYICFVFPQVFFFIFYYFFLYLCFNLNFPPILNAFNFLFFFLRFCYDIAYIFRLFVLFLQPNHTASQQNNSNVHIDVSVYWNSVYCNCIVIKNIFYVFFFSSLFLFWKVFLMKFNERNKQQQKANEHVI